MIINNRFWILLLVFLYLITFSACNQEETEPFVVVTTTEVTNLTQNSAKSGGTIKCSDKYVKILQAGVCWSTDPNPWIFRNNNVTYDIDFYKDKDTTIVNDSSGVKFTSSLKNLEPGTTYYLRSYAEIGSGTTTYGNEIIFGTTMTDTVNNIYHVVTIGTQTWMVENLRTTKYNDGTIIPTITDNTAWKNSSTPAYCWYSNKITPNKNKYGALYNWDAVNTRKLAPKGWHVPTEDDWIKLEKYLSSHLGKSGSIAKALADTIGWGSSTIEGAIGNDLSINNSSGFTAIPGGYRIDNGQYTLEGSTCGFWSATNKAKGIGIDSICGRKFNFESKTFEEINLYNKKNGFYVRCVKN